MFTASQEAMIKELAATGDLLGAQKIVLGEIQHEMGGVAEAYGKTLPGQIDIAREAFKNLMETIGKSAIPALTEDLKALIGTFKVFDALKIPAMLGGVVKGFMDFKTALKLIPGVGAVVELGQSIWNLGKSLLGLKKPPKITADIDTIGAVKSINELTGGFERWKSLAAEKKKIDIDTKTASDNLKALDEIVATLDADLKDLTAVSTGVGKKIADELAMKGLAGVTRNDMIAVLHELQAVEPANRKAGYDAMQAFMDAIALSSSEMQEHGTAIMDALKLGIEKAANAGPITAEIIQNLINGLVAQYPELKPVADRLGAILSSGIIAGATPPPGSAAEIAQKWVDVFKGLGGMQPKETKKVSIETTETGSKQTIANLKQVQKWANTIGSLKPTVKANANVDGAQQRFSDLLNRLQKYNGQVVTTVIIKAAIQGSGPFTADQYARYLEDTIASATPSVNVNIGIGGGGATDTVNNLQKAWDILNKTAIYGWSQATEVALGRFGDMEAGIASLGDNMTSQILAWRNMRGALDEANISLKNYDDQIAASEKEIKGLETQQTALNQALEASKAELSKLSTMKIAGEGAASDKSFALEQQSRQLQFAIMQAEDAKNYELASQLTLQKEIVDRQKEEADLQAGITYDPQKRELEKLLDPLGQQEMSYDEIKARIIELTLNTIPSQQKAYDDITGTIEAQRLQLEGIQEAHDEAAVKVAFYSEQVELMAKNFLTRYDEMIAKAKELNDQTGGAGAGGPANYQTGGPVGPGGGTVEYGEFVLSKPMLKAMGTQRMSPVNVNYSGGDTVVHSHTYLNGREIAHDVSREIGRNASAYSRSGGRY